MRTLILTAIITLLSSTAAVAQVEVSRTGLINVTALRRYGLERQWHTHVAVDRSRGELSSITPFISQVRGFTVYEVSDGRRVYKFSERDRDRFGDKIGKEAAERMAKDQKNLFIRIGVKEPTMEEKLIPEVVFYCATNHGVVHAIDAENGETIWVRTIGGREHPTLRPGANEQYVAVANGSTLYVVDRLTGKDVWSRPLLGTPGAGPALADDLVHIPMVDGMVETYNLREHRTPRTFYKSHGRATMQPIVTPRLNLDPDEDNSAPFLSSSLVWATNRGQVYVNNANKKGDARYRLEANDVITSPPVFLAPNRILVTSLDGYVYCAHEYSGDIMWRFSTGQPISRSAAPINDYAFVTTDDGGMFKINTETGLEDWWTPRVRRFLAASEGRVYAQSETGRMVVIDSATGGVIGAMGTEPLDFAISNIWTDRIYIGTSTGMLQCLREIPNEYPTFYNVIKPEERPQIQQAGLDDGKPEDPAGTKPSNPFGGGAPAADPFGGGAPAADPFGGGGKDPFGAAPAGGADPFGAAPAGGANPFGGGAPAADPFGAGAPAGGAPAADPFGAGAPAGGAAPAADPFGAGGADPFK